MTSLSNLLVSESCYQLKIMIHTSLFVTKSIEKLAQICGIEKEKGS